MNDGILAECLHHQHRGMPGKPATHPILCSTVNGHEQGIRQEWAKTRADFFQ
ncbi:MAG: hypothetical protein AWT59_1887 [Candidatus Gallionella acididurans]|uniref:Uncharacterized protein n=1 Tax=Candidatus Gallionella acididurans TaxID=1796491 RepID=A0A139BT84_9PROT|nr:MAG: hypothetical protein AWT59_1887 [Candidatus Gallionella acididurans]